MTDITGAEGVATSIPWWKTGYWTKEQDDFLKKRWAEGYSASMIAREMHKSRNAVIGRKSRLGLEKRRETPILAIAKRAPRKKPRKKTVKEVIRPPIEYMPVAGGVHIVDLEPIHCRAIVGRGDDGLARYCGSAKPSVAVNGSVAYEGSWCPTHKLEYMRKPPVR